MIRRRFVLAAAAAAAVILSAPFVQQAFVGVSTAWPAYFRPLAIGATAVPAAVAVGYAVSRIVDRRPFRYAVLAVALGIGAGYVVVGALSVTETFHFVEYGLVGMLFYRAARALDGEVPVLLVLPLVAGTIAGTLDEWFQWFIPIRAGEARDVLLNTAATACGLLVAVAVDPPARGTWRLRPGSAPRLAAATAVAGVVFVAFFLTVHVGHDVVDSEIGSFRSRYAADALARASRDRAARWRDRPPVVQRWVGREDQYLTEALWHVARRNEAWVREDLATAWWENRILEKYYAPVLDSPTYASPSGHRWPDDQRADAAARAGAEAGPRVSVAYAYPLYVWPARF